MIFRIHDPESKFHRKTHPVFQQIREPDPGPPNHPNKEQSGKATPSSGPGTAFSPQTLVRHASRSISLPTPGPVPDTQILKQEPETKIRATLSTQNI